MVTIGNLEGYTWNEREDIRKTYALLDKSELGRNDPYIIDLKFSPIEYEMWWSIRLSYKAKYFRPEFPIGKYFADFADPIHKIVIECDGKQYHTDIEKDKIRQTEIEKLGWFVLRFNSSQILSNIYYKKILPLCESGDVEEDDLSDLIFKNRHNCVDCYFMSKEFSDLLDNRKYIKQ